MRKPSGCDGQIQVENEASLLVLLPTLFACDLATALICGMDESGGEEQPWNALSLPFPAQVDSLIDAFPALAWLRPLSLSEQLPALSTLLKNSNYALKIARLFSPLLLDLTARWLDDTQDDEAKFIVFGLLVPAHEELYPVLARFLTRPSLKGGPLAFVNADNADAVPIKTLHVLLVAYIRLIEAIPHIHTEFGWPIVHLQCLLNPPHPDSGARLLATRCAAHHVGMNESARIPWEEKLVGTAADVDALVETGFGETVSVWALPLLDHKRVVDERVELRRPFELCRRPETISPSTLSRSVIQIGGHLLLRPDKPSLPTSFVATETTIEPLHRIAHLLQTRQPVMISGSSSSGKSVLIGHLADTLHPAGSPSIITVHLADTSLDARSLLGSYVSSSTKPGTFEWKDGAVVQALRNGTYLVLDNIDKASSEVLGMLWPLVESLSMAKPIGGHASIEVFNRGTVLAKEGFALFATRSIAGPSRALGYPPNFLGSHKWRRITLPDPTTYDINSILQFKYPEINEALGGAMIDVWNLLRALDPQSEGHPLRPIELRDLMKWCQRMKLVVSSGVESSHSSMDIDSGTVTTLASIITNPLTREAVFLDAASIFFGSCSPENTKAKARIMAGCDVLAQHLSISSDRLQWLVEKRVPEMEIIRNKDGYITGVLISSTYLPAHTSLPLPQVSQPSHRPFALHRPSLNLLSVLAACVQSNEPALLVGETGTGKTTAISHLASLLSQPLISLNLSHQTESSDLLGGYKPLDPRSPARALQSKFTTLFSKTFSRDKNVKYEEAIRMAVSGAKWKRAVALWREAATKAKERIQARVENGATQSFIGDDLSAPRKRRKIGIEERPRVTEEEWGMFEKELALFESHHVHGSARAMFSFVEGPLITAIRCGHWVLLDEINLASMETLEAISSILRAPGGSFTLLEQGYTESIKCHPNFRLFACMNPATDVGKKDLPPHIRSYLTELYVSAPDGDMDALLAIVSQYIGQIALGDRAAIMDVAQYYTNARKMAQAGELADGSNQRPHYSMRTLSRALTFAADVSPAFGLRRALWEGCLMAFSTILSPESAKLLSELALRHLLGTSKNIKSLLAQNPPPPSDGKDYVSVGPFWLQRGPMPQLPVGHYILTPSVQSKLLDLARIITTRRFPILIEGPTSSGKTSAIEYLARLTGHRFVRINNHEHTDIQEYIGSYVTNPQTGQLGFQDGLLVRALREGHWIVLDELNLAPSDVLEALNRLLDDNRELIVPETGEVVTPHASFMLFATQNPPGLYGGRKILSRAFRNRFLEVHFQDVPQPELEQIIRERCGIAPSYAQRIVSVFRELQTRRQTGRMFETKQGFATLRDLFRWAGRDAGSVQELAEIGYMLIAEKSRRNDDKSVVKEVIQDVLKVTIDEKVIYNVYDPVVAGSLSCPIPSESSVVWTCAMQRLFVLVSRALRHNEPVLLVGDTGSGKTSVCELYSHTVGSELYTVNCHQSTETADLLGGQRPIRNRRALLSEREKVVSSTVDHILSDHHPGQHLSDRLEAALRNEVDEERRSLIREAQKVLRQPVPLFDWQDGPLVHAMRSGSAFLLDEISLADDSVLERLNSVLEPSRTLVLAEMGGHDPEKLEIRAKSGFQLMATMNPGGDHGKRELSPALRNRFTEIWVPPIIDNQDRLAIVQASWRNRILQPYTERVVGFLHGVAQQLGDLSTYGLRDLLTWVQFSDKVIETTTMSPDVIFHHSAHLVVLDGLTSIPQTQGWTITALSQIRHKITEDLIRTVPLERSLDPPDFTTLPGYVKAGGFKIPMGNEPQDSTTFETQAPTTLKNLYRILRACQLEKPIMLEGSPGVGKTSVITALAALCRRKLCRVNLSDQTDIMDLFGSDLPVEGGQAGEFVWKDAAFLTALQRGDWVLLDEMNLAPQSVLEGLNAVLDHRGTVFIPELGRSFARHPSFRLFAAQNPVQQGGGRKGLPKSFVNRFTKVYLDELDAVDLLMIIRRQQTALPEHIARDIIRFNQKIHVDTTVLKIWGSRGSPWEFNLRDIMRWLKLLADSSKLEIAPHDPVEFVPEIFLHRFRNSDDRQMVRTMTAQIFSTPVPSGRPHLSMTPQYTQIGHSIIPCKPAWSRSTYNPPIIQAHLGAFEVAARCIAQGWLVLLIGHAGMGKTTFMKLLGHLYGSDIVHFSANSATDTTDLLGGFEQQDAHAKITHASTLSDSPDIINFHQPSGDPAEGHKLNSLCELEGLLTLTERGLVNGEIEYIKPHQDFRFFMTIDPANGELSRAMRNRGVEIYLDTSINTEDKLRMDIFNRRSTGQQATPRPSDRLQDIWGYVSLSPVQHVLRLAQDIHFASSGTKISILCQLLSLPAVAALRHFQDLDLFVTENHTSNSVLPVSLIGLPQIFIDQLPLEIHLNRNIVSRLKHIGCYAQLERESCLRIIRLCVHQGKTIALRSIGRPASTVLDSSRDLISGRTASDHGSDGIKAVSMVFDAWCSALEQLLSPFSSRFDVFKYYKIAEISDQVCEIVEATHIDYAQWRSVLQDLQEILPEMADTQLVDAVSRALSSTRLSSGFLMDKIWATCKPLCEAESRLMRLLNLLDSSQSDGISSNDELLQRALDLVSIGSFKDNEPTPLGIPTDTAPFFEDHPYDEVSRQLILLFPRLLSSSSPRSCPHIDRFCSVAIRIPTFPHRCTALLKTVGWALRLNIESNQYLSNALKSWISSLWEGSLSGIEIMTKPSALISTITLCSGRRRPLRSRKSYIGSLSNSLDLIRLEFELPRSDLSQTMEALLTLDYEIVREMLVIDEDKQMDSAVPATMDNLLRAIPEDTAALQTLQRIKQLAIKASLHNSHLSVCLRWVFLGGLILHLYIPSLPLDPQGAISGIKRCLERSQSRLKEEISFHRQAEIFATGNDSNPAIEFLEAHLIDVETRLKDIPASSQSQRDMSEVHSLFSELIRFHDQILRTDRLTGLLNGLVNAKPDTQRQEEVDQDSWKRFLERIETKYDALADLVYPVIASLNRIRLGISLLRHRKNSDNTDPPSISIMRSLTSFPSSVGRAIISSGSLTPPSSIPPQEWSTLRITAILAQLARGESLKAHTRQLWVGFEQLFGVWLQKKLKEDEKNAEDSSLYKRKKDAVMQKAEAEQEAEEFQRLFPEYGDILDENYSRPQTNFPATPDQTAYSLFSHLPSSNAALFGVFNTTADETKSLTVKWMYGMENILAADIDQESVAFRLKLVSQRLDQVQHRSLRPKTYNFYHDSNIPEAYRAYDVVLALQSRLKHLIGKWPDQMVLQHLSERCEAILNLDIDSSLARILSALEQLLLQTEDWQKYADKENSISIHQQALSGLIVDWRRFELSGWTHLLDNQAREFAQGLEEWWFRLYENVVHVCITTDVREANLESHMEKLTPLVESFLTTSPLGQFTSRIHLLQQFHVYIDNVAARYAPSPAVLYRAAQLLRSISQFYSQFIPAIEARLSQLRNDVDKDVKSFVQMASWKDINVLALKASAQRTHHQLHKALRKFRSILQEPVSPLLTQPVKQASRHEPNASLGQYKEFVHTVPVLDRIAREAGHLSKLQEALQASLSSHSSDISGHDLTKLVNYVHSILRHALESRSSLCSFILTWRQIERMIETLDDVTSVCRFVACGPTAAEFLYDHHSILCRAISSVDEILDITQQLSQTHEQWDPFDAESIEKLRQCQQAMTNKKQEISRVLNRRGDGRLLLLLRDEALREFSSASIVDDLVKILKMWCLTDSRVLHLCSALVDSLEAHLDTMSRISDEFDSQKEITERPISIILVMMQRLRGLDSKPDSEQYIKDGAHVARTRNQVLDPSQLQGELESFLSNVVGAPDSTIYFQRLYPFLQRFRSIANSHIESVIAWTEALFKLAFILISLGQDLADRGFCQPSEEGESSKQGEMHAEGTGVGEGSGDKDVSEEIQDESQIEGLRGDEEEKMDREGKDDGKKDEGVEMTEDFDGALESIGNDSDGQEDQESVSDEEEVEDRVEELDPADPDAVDEKMWEGRKEDGSQREEKRSDKPSKAESAQDSEMAAKEDPSKRDDKKGDEGE
ncbi:hypothetical protein FRC17_002942, partial [Serendipita sp. 399]